MPTWRRPLPLSTACRFSGPEPMKRFDDTVLQLRFVVVVVVRLVVFITILSRI